MEKDVRKNGKYTGDFAAIQQAVLGRHCAVCARNKLCGDRECWEERFGQEAYRYYSTYRLQPVA